MSLEALAPDQRAVVQLVLQQERSYDDLAGLLGISTDAVRERARAGLESVGGSRGDLTDEELGEIADYLLGQQSVSRREATRSLLGSSADARRWAGRVSAALADVARSPLPGVPEPDADVSPTTAAPSPEPATAPALALLPDERDEEAAEEPEDEREDEPVQEPVTAPVRARPRPRAAAEEAPRPRPRPGADGGTGAPRSSKIGGALLLGGIAILLVAVVFFILTRGDDDAGTERAAEGTPAPTATAEATPAAAGQIDLTAPGGGDAKGTMTILVSQDGQVQFSIEGTDVPPSREGEAYAVWLIGGGEPKRLGFAPTVGEDGRLGVSGPREGDEESFPRDFSRARRVVVSRETTQDAEQPGPVVLQGTIPRANGSG